MKSKISLTSSIGMSRRNSESSAKINQSRMMTVSRKGSKLPHA